jgi:hypothetical protein
MEISTVARSDGFYFDFTIARAYDMAGGQPGTRTIPARRAGAWVSVRSLPRNQVAGDETFSVPSRHHREAPVGDK